ncbi:MAG: membrane dipeptidase [Ignavibacteriaceae bacterium]
MKHLSGSKTFLLFIIISTSSTFLFANGITFSGIVSEKATSLPLDSAEIKIINKINPAEYYLTKTNAAGFWSYTIPFSSAEENPAVPNTFSLEQNFPNPFNPSTRILFSTGQTGNARLSMYNVVGELIDQVSLFLDEGNYSIDWNSKGAAGVLFYSLEFDGKRITKKMVQLDGGEIGGFGNITSYNSPPGNANIENTLTSEYLVIASKLIYMPDTLTIPLTNNLSVDFSLRTVHDAVFVFDLHNDVMEKVINGYNIGIRNTNNQSDLPRFKEGGMDAQMFAIWVSPGDTVGHTHYSYSMEMIDSFDSQVSRYNDRLIQATTYNEIISGAETGKLVGVLALEGGHSIANDLEKLRNFYNRGVRYMTITWNNSTSWAVSGQDARSTTVGLSDFGRQVIRLMDSLGMIIDVAHTGIKTISDILAITKNPIVDTHCGARKLRNHYRNLYDYQIDSIAARGGVIGVVFYPPFLSSSNSTNIDTVIKHIDYIKNRVGIDYVSIGSDFDGIESTPFGLEDVSKLPKLTAALIRKGYSITDIRKLMGENYLRVYKQVCK